jgi:F-box domain
MKRPRPSSTDIHRTDQKLKQDYLHEVGNDTIDIDDNDDDASKNECSPSSFAWIKIISATYGPCEESFGDTIVPHSEAPAAVAARAPAAHAVPSSMSSPLGTNDDASYTIPAAISTITSVAARTTSLMGPGSRDCLSFVKALLWTAVVQEQREDEGHGHGLHPTCTIIDDNPAKLVTLDCIDGQKVGTDLLSPPTGAVRVPLTVNGSSRTFVRLLSGVGGKGCSMNAAFGDPCPGTSKRLHICYTVNEDGSTEIFHATFAEHERVTIRRRHLTTSVLTVKRASNQTRQDGGDYMELFQRHQNNECKTITWSLSWSLDSDTSELVLPHVLPYLEVQQRVQCRMVCRRWKSVISESGVASVIDSTDRSMAPNFTRPFLRGILRYSYQSLQSLVLCGFRDIEKEDLHPSIPHLQVLRSLDLTRCIHLDDSTMSLLSQHVCTTIQVLYLKGLRKITDAGLMMICRSCRSLEVLDISHISSITDKGGTSINHLTKLRALFLRDNHLLTNHSLDAITQSCTQLSQLTLWGCIKMNHLEFDTKTFGGGGRLVILNLCGCYSLHDDAAEAIRRMNHLNSLIVNECHRLTDNFFQSLVVERVSLPRLQHLHLRYLRLLTDRGLQIIGRHIHELFSLDLSFCTQITHDGVYDLLEARFESLTELCLKSCRNLEISIPRRGPDGRFPDVVSNDSQNRLHFRTNRFDGLGRNVSSGRRNLATNTGHWILNSLRPRGPDHALCVLDVRCCDGKSFDYRYDINDDFSTGMSALNFKQSVPGYFVRLGPIGSKRNQRAVSRICHSMWQAERTNDG